MARVLLVAAAALLGGCVASFLDLVAWRVPRGESIVTPRSRCPACGRTLRIGDLVPVVSFLMLRGRCRDCDARIPLRELVVELAVAASFGATAWIVTQ